MYVLSGLKTLGIIHSCSSLVYTGLENYKWSEQKVLPATYERWLHNLQADLLMGLWLGTWCFGEDLVNIQQVVEHGGSTAIIGTLRSNDADDNKNVKKTIGLISKTTTLHVHHTFLHISFPFLHDYDVKMPNFAFYGGRKQPTKKFYFSFWTWIWSLEIQLQEGSPTIDEESG